MPHDSTCFCFYGGNYVTGGTQPHTQEPGGSALVMLDVSDSSKVLYLMLAGRQCYKLVTCLLVLMLPSVAYWA